MSERIKQQYKVQNKAARLYYTKELIHCKRAAAVDIGWAGSGAISLAFLVERIWNLPCEIVGIIAGTNTIHNKESDASEIFLQSGKLVSYLFSQSDNREVMKKHNRCPFTMNKLFCIIQSCCFILNLILLYNFIKI